MPVELYTVEGAAPQHHPALRAPAHAERRIAFTRLGLHVRISANDLEEFVARGRVEAASRMRRPVGGGS